MSINVYIGSEPKTAIAAQVLIHTIKKNINRRALDELNITLMEGEGWEYPIKGIKVGTGFSLRRWMIPKAMNWQGGAIYLDADQIVFGDLTELLAAHGAKARANPDAVIGCSFQPDKYSKTPWPQTSVMLIDCEKAKPHWGFDIERVLAHLREFPGNKVYADLMHAAWLAPRQIVELPVEWNHLNVYQHGKTKLLHYTKENEQPWYNPDHKLAKHWNKALQDAIDDGLVTQEMIRHALSQWGKKQDWRPTNGLHPHYKRYLKN